MPKKPNNSSEFQVIKTRELSDGHVLELGKFGEELRLTIRELGAHSMLVFAPDVASRISDKAYSILFEVAIESLDDFHELSEGTRQDIQDLLRQE